MATLTADMLTAEQFRQLIEHTDEHCVSIYLPTHLAGRDVTEDPIRLKDLVGRAEHELAERGMRPADARSMLQPLKALAEDASHWRYNRSAGMAAFADPTHGARYYHLPLAFDELAVVTDRYHMKPLIPLFTDDSRFYVLALSEGSVRLLQGTHYTVREIEVPGMPKSFEDLDKYIDDEEQLQLHTGTPFHKPGPSGKPGDRGEAMYHTQHAGSDAAEEKGWLADYCFIIDKRVTKELAHERAPLVLAATEPLVGLYRKASHYRYLMEGPVWGNPDMWDERGLHDRAWPRVERTLTEARDKAVARYENTALEGRSDQIEPILLAALDGRIDQLLVSAEANRWGRFDAEARKCEVHDEKQLGDEDLLDRAAMQSWQTSATVYTLPQERMPEGTVVAGIWRY